MAFGIADFVAERILLLKKNTQLFPPCHLILYISHKVWGLLMPNIPSESAIEIYVLLGPQVKIHLVVETHQIDFMAQDTVILTRQCPYANQHHFQCLVYTAFTSFKYTSTYCTMTLCEYIFDD